MKIGNVNIRPGQQYTINLPVAKLYTHTEMTMPVHILSGKKDGPRLFVSAAIHGDEILGVEIIRRLLKLKVLKRLRGVLLAVPIVNVYGFIQNSRYSPDRRDLNRFFPGSSKGSLTSQLANLFMQEIVASSTHGIDLHAGSNHRINLPQIRASLDDPETKRLASAFGAPVIIDANVRDGSLRQAVSEMGIPMLLYEGGEALRFDEVAVRAGTKGILSLMRSIGMLPKTSVKPAKITPLIASSTTWMRAPASGILNSRVSLGTKIKKNAKIGHIADPFGEHETDVIAKEAGVVIGRLNLPLVHAGDALFHIAGFDSPDSARETILDFHEEFDPNPQTN